MIRELHIQHTRLRAKTSEVAGDSHREETLEVKESVMHTEVMIEHQSVMKPEPAAREPVRAPYMESVLSNWGVLDHGRIMLAQNHKINVRKIRTF